MHPRLTVVTLGVTDVSRALAFYKQGLGWPTAFEQDDVAFFQLSGVILALYPRHLLAEDATVDPKGNGFSGVTLAHNVGSEREVDAVLEEARTAGATIARRGEKAVWGGYRGYFADPDGYLWEVVYNPQWPLDNQGRLTIGRK